MHHWEEGLRSSGLLLYCSMPAMCDVSPPVVCVNTDAMRLVLALFLVLHAPSLFGCTSICSARGKTRLMVNSSACFKWAAWTLRKLCRASLTTQTHTNLHWIARESVACTKWCTTPRWMVVPPQEGATCYRAVGGKHLLRKGTTIGLRSCLCQVALVGLFA